jgi:hypothetical protein
MDSDCLVLRTSDHRFFRDWVRQKTGPVFHFCAPLACARPFSNQVLAKAFQRFLTDHGIQTDIFAVEQNKLLRQVSPEPRRKPPRPRIEPRIELRNPYK